MSYNAEWIENSVARAVDGAFRDMKWCIDNHLICYHDVERTQHGYFCTTTVNVGFILNNIDQMRAHHVGNKVARQICKSVGATGKYSQVGKTSSEAIITIWATAAAVRKYFELQEGIEHQKKIAHDMQMQMAINKVMPIVSRLEKSSFIEEVADLLKYGSRTIVDHVIDTVLHRTYSESIYVTNERIEWGPYSSDYQGPEYGMRFEEHGYRKLKSKDEVLAVTYALSQEVIRRITSVKQIPYEITYNYYPDSNSDIAARAVFSITFEKESKEEVVLKDIF